MGKIHRYSELNIASGQSAQYEKYWLAQLAGEISKSTFPYDSLEAKTGQVQMESVKYEFSQEIRSRLIQLSNHSDSRLHMILTAALNVLLERYTGISDIILGTPIYRQKEEGEFINTVLALRNRIKSGTTFKELILQVRQTILEAVENQNYPLEIALEQLNITSAKKDFPLFGVVVLIENIQYEKYIDHLTLETVFSFLRKDTGIELTLKYNPSLYRRETIEGIITRFRRLLEKIIFDVDMPVLEIEILAENEQKRILFEFNRTTREFPHDKSIVELFTAQAEHNPHRAAVVYDHQHLTYGGLHELSTRLAGVLRQRGSSGDNITALLLERSIEMIIAIFGILKSGGAYLPLDPQSPPARNRLILEDSRAGIIVTQKQWLQGNSDVLNDFPPERIIVFDHRKKYPFRFPALVNHIDVSYNPGNLAYILYTSGTTGMPKGVMIRHHCVNNLVYGLNDRVYKRYGKGLKVALAASYIFDASVKQIFAALLLGHCLYVVAEETRLDGERLLDYYRKEKIDVSDGTPAHLTLILEAPAKHRCGLPLKHLLIGGERLPQELADAFFQEFAAGTPVITNVYGPAECCVDTTSFEISNENIKELTYIPIGTPMPNKQVYILDEKNRVQPIGVVGELYIGGVGVARGYLNRPELTNDKFVEQVTGAGDRCRWGTTSNEKFLEVRKPFFKKVFGPRRERIYKTGDLGRWHGDGNIEFLGRRDSQVKIRGFRIELEEIRSQLLKHEDIKDAVVTTKGLAAASGSVGGKSNRDEYICAYIVSDREVNISPLKEYLSGKLPGYMIPAYFKQVEKIPLTPNGKTDLRALPAPQPGAEKTNYIAPASRVEKRLLGIWHEVLGVPLSSIGMRDNFFDLGGHSLKAVILINRIRGEFQVEFPLREVFRSPTIQMTARYIAAAGKQEYEKIQPVEKREYYHCSSVQKRLYILQQMEKNITAYNIPTVLVLEGKLHRQRLEKTFRKLLQRHEGLRISFTTIQDNPVQRVHDEVEFEIEFFDTKSTAQGAERKEHGLSASCALHPANTIQNFIRPFDLTRAPLLRVRLIREDEAKHLLMIDMHHIISDGTSTGILATDFMGLYAGQDLSPLRISYRDYSDRQNRQYENKKMQQQEAFWLEELKEDLPALNLPTDNERTPVLGFDGDVVTIDIPRKETAMLKALAAAEEATLYMVLLSVYYLVLARVSGQEDIVVGSVVEGRNHDDLRQVIGMFVNTLPLRNYPHAEKTYRGFLQEVRERTLNAFENQDYPFKELVEKVSTQRDISRNPLFDVAFVFHNLETPELKIPGMKLAHYEYEKKTSKFDLTLAAAERGGDLSMGFEYRTGLFKETTIKRLSEFLKKIIVFVIAQPGRKIRDIEIISGVEKKQLLYDFNDTEREYPGEKTVHELFEQQVERTPDHTALVGGNPRPQIPNPKPVTPFGQVNAFGAGHLTNRELNEKSERLAHRLIGKGVGPGTIVAIMVERSLEMIVGILGILKTGAAYLPIDANYPHERIKFMLNDSGSEILITTYNLTEAEPGSLPGKKNYKIGFPGSFIGYDFTLSTLAPVYPASAANLAYVIYTSGSTGRPKGILIRHRNVVNFIEGITSRITFEMGKSILCLTTISFDIFVLETLLPLTKGLKMIIANEQEQLDPELLKELVKQNHIDMVQVTPSHLKLLLEDFDWLRGVSVLMVGGEAFPDSVFSRLTGRFSGQVYNLYGPTETTVWSTLKKLSGGRGEAITIGRPISNTYIYILARNRQLQPIGVPGELCIGGDGLARGYLNQPELTAEKFCQDLWDYQDYHDKRKKIPGKNPMQPCNHAIMPYHFPSPHHPNTPIPQYPHSPIYRTGDLARWLPEGDIDFLGRMDHQVKIRGFRIELGEIRSQLLGHEEVKDVVVTTKGLAAANGSTAGKNNREEYICAYIVSDREVNISQLKEYLSGKLPGYMIPAYFKQVEKIPLTLNGKIDRRALPTPEVKTGEGYAAPGNALEEKLAALWSEVLAIEKDVIGIEDNFFELGGHSLKATILASKIHKAFDAKITIREIFIQPNIRGLADHLKSAVKNQYASIKPVEMKEYYDMSHSQKRLWLQSQIKNASLLFNMPAAYIIEEELNTNAFSMVFQSLIQRHESLRTIFITIDHEPKQKRLSRDEIEFHMEYIDLKEDKDRDKKSRQLAEAESVTWFDLSKGPLLRVKLIQLEEKKYLFLFTMHHIISDARSMNVLYSEALLLYNRYHRYKGYQEADGKKNSLKPLRIHYKDYAAWQNIQFKEETIKSHKNYWLKQLDNRGPNLELPLDKNRPAINTYNGTNFSFYITKERTASLRTIGEKNNTTLFMTLLTVFNVFLYGFTGETDIIIGTPVAGREHADLEGQIGYYLNTLALRTRFQLNNSFAELLNKVKKVSMEAFEHQIYPFDILVDNLGIERDISRHPLFDVMIDMINYEGFENEYEEAIRGLKGKPFETASNKSKFDLTIYLFEGPDTIKIAFEYNVDLFEAETISYMADFFQRLVKNIIENPVGSIENLAVEADESPELLLMGPAAMQPGKPNQEEM